MPAAEEAKEAANEIRIFEEQTREGDKKAAIKRHSKEDPTAAEEAKERGNERFRLQRWEAAAREYTSAVNLSRLPRFQRPDLAAVYLSNRAACYIRLQRFHEAEICLLHALQLGGPALPHYINLITLASLRGDFALARHYIDAAAAIDPKHPQLAQVRDQVKSQEAAQPARYAFAAHWAPPSLQPVPAP